MLLRYNDRPRIVKEIEAKTILSKSQIYDYALNAYVGCQHQCLYCYAKFMKRFTGHREPWGAFVAVKINAAELLAREVKKKKKGRVLPGNEPDHLSSFPEDYVIIKAWR